MKPSFPDDDLHPPPDPVGPHEPDPDEVHPLPPLRVPALSDLTIKRTDRVMLTRIFMSAAVIIACLLGGYVFWLIDTDRDGWQSVALTVQEENEDLRQKLETQSDELACRSEAAAVESAALGELQISIGRTAEAALRMAAGETVPPEERREIAADLAQNILDVQAASRDRVAAIDDCAEPTTTTQETEPP